MSRQGRVQPARTQETGHGCGATRQWRPQRPLSLAVLTLMVRTATDLKVGLIALTVSWPGGSD